MCESVVEQVALDGGYGLCHARLATINVPGQGRDREMQSLGGERAMRLVSANVLLPCVEIVLRALAGDRFHI
jgi:hypothetical protein